MKSRFLAAATVGAFALVCLGPTEATAGSHKRSHAHASAQFSKGKKVKKRKVVVQCGKYCAIVTALSAKSAAVSTNKRGKWHGWVATRKGFAFYLNGARYKGGTPYGPAMAYNNWEGGFNRRAFWEITDRDRY